MNKKNNKSKKKEKKKINIGLIIIICIITIVLLSAGIFFFIRYKMLDGRACMTCPYVYDLKVEDIEILDKNIRGTKVELELGTGIESIKIDGKVTLRYECNVNYCFMSSYIGRNCSWNYPSKGTVTYEFDESSIESKSFSVEPVNSPTSIYMYQNTVKCDFIIDGVNGKLMIYGEKVR